MTTIFVMALKKLIKAQLSPLSARQKIKSERPLLYDTVLSLQQQIIIDKLSDDIVRFAMDGDDETCAKALAGLIDTARAKVQPERESHKKSKDEGETVNCLGKLSQHIIDLYKKLAELKKTKPELYSFNLLNTPYRHNPLHIIYAMAIDYFGEQIFDPNGHIDVKTRAAKEIKLAERMRSLSERVKPGYDLDAQRARALEMLKDIIADNKKIVNDERSFLASLSSKVTFLGMAVNLNPTSEGRLGRLLAVAQISIEGMTEAEFEPLAKMDANAAPEQVASAAAAAPSHAAQRDRLFARVNPLERAAAAEEEPEEGLEQLLRAADSA